MSKERFKLRCAVYLMLLRGNDVLFLRRFNQSWENGKYSLVAGHLDGNETAIEAMVRETKEEAGIDVDKKDVISFHAMHRIASDSEYIDLFFLAKKWQGEPRIMEPDKCDDMSWFSIDDLPDNLLDYIYQAIDGYKNKNPFSIYIEK